MENEPQRIVETAFTLTPLVPDKIPPVLDPWHPPLIDLAKPNSLQRILHGRSSDNRQAVVDALASSCHHSDQKAAGRINDCCRSARVYIDSESGHTRTWLKRCMHRACPFCGRHLTKTRARLISPHLEDLRQWRFITLTYRSNDQPLREQLDALRRAFKTLRRDKRWKARVDGGFYSLQSTFNRRTLRWHPHVHVLVHGRYYEEALLKAMWMEVKPDGEIVDIRACEKRYETALEISQYVSRNQDFTTWPQWAIREWIHATKGRRLVDSFGVVYGKVKLPEKEVPTDAPTELYLPLADLASVARYEMPHALEAERRHRLLYGYDSGFNWPASVALCSLIRQRYPLFDTYLCYRIPGLPGRLDSQIREAMDVEAGRVAAPPGGAAERKAAADAALDDLLAVHLRRYVAAADAARLPDPVGVADDTS